VTGFSWSAMPVTAKLSKRFYEVLGEDVANELVEWFNAVDLTYRADLRELNEMNFARFDAKLEQRAAQLDAKIEQSAAQLDAKIEQRAAQIEAKLEERFIRLSAKLDAVSATLQSSIEAAMEKTRAELLKWMFGATVALLGAMIALVRLQPGH
jgi:ABC-type phosphate transport system auxiliary subunit